MLKKIKNWLNRKKQTKAQREKMIKMQEYYKILKCGAVLIDYIYKDLEKQKKDHMNRHRRRRFEKSLKHDGKYNEEIVKYYSQQIDTILKQVNESLNPPKKKKELDGSKVYEQLKKQEKTEK